MTRQLAIIVGGLGALAILTLSAYFVWFAPANYRGAPKVFKVQTGQSVAQIVDGLAKDKLVRSELGTRIAFKLSRASRVRAGSYDLSPRMDAWQIAQIIGGGNTTDSNITIPEGYTIKQIAALLEKKSIMPADDFTTAAEHYTGNLDFMNSRPEDGSLEGYLFPDTYRMSKGATPQEVIDQMLATLKRRLEAPLAQVGATTQSLMIHQILTLASLVEKEARTDEDRKLIAGVLLNRLDKGMRLDVDATVRYITDNWTSPITQADLASNSPYNTRKFS
ncbi:MAG: endolytic transglycosylase MltG, partial [bacterium]